MLLILALSAALAAGAQTADMVVVNARIHTLDGARPRADALAVRNGRILAVGGDMAEYAGPRTRRIDAGGATIVPGFIDSHGHMRGLGESLESLDLRHTATLAEALELVRAAVSKRRPGEWVRGRGWDQTRWLGREFPTAAQLSGVSPNNPVYLTRVDGHAAWANRRALEAAGITVSTPDPPGGRILRDAAGWPTGVLIDRAMGLVARRIPPPDQSRIREQLARAASECARLGITSVHDAGVSSHELSAYRTLIAEGRLPVRVYAMIGGEGSLWESFLKRGPEIGERLTVRCIKLMADGALGSRGAALKEPYTDESGNLGLLILERRDIERVARAAVAQGFQVATHAIGDRANRVALEAYGAALASVDNRRFRIEHAQVVSPEDVELFARHGVIASIQATHATSDMRWAEARLGPQRVLGAYAWRTFLAGGVRIANGSDFPVEDANPLWGFYASITRQDHSGSPQGGWMAAHRLSREEALRSWTIDGAYAAFEETLKGTLAPGKAADFVILSHDIMTVPPPEILKARVNMTVLAGEVVYAAQP